MEEYAYNDSQQKGNNLVVGDATCKDADADIGCTHQQQADISAYGGTMIYISQLGDSYIVGPRKK